MAISDFVKNSDHGRIVLSDGTGTPVTHTELYDLGDISVTGLGPKLNNRVHHQRRGKYVSSSYTDRRFVGLTVSGYHTGTAASAPGSMADFLLQKAPYASNISTLGTGRMYAVDITITFEGTDFGDAADGTVTFRDCVPQFDFTEQMDGNRFSFSFEVLGAVEGDWACAGI